MKTKAIWCLITMQILFTLLTALHFAAELAFDQKRLVLASVLYPWDYRYPFQVAAAHLLNKNYETAEAYYRRTLEIFPTFLEAQNNLAVVWALTGRKKQAENLWREILTVDPGYRSARENLMRLHKMRPVDLPFFPPLGIVLHSLFADLATDISFIWGDFD